MQQLNRSYVLFVMLFTFVMVTVSVQAATFKITIGDRLGNEMSGVSVTVAPENGDAVTGVSDASGAVEISDLAAGIYTITASAPGYSDKIMTNVRLSADETMSVAITLSAEVIELDQISVTASRRREKVLEAPASVAFLDDSQIRDRVTPNVTEHLKSLRAVDVVSCWIKRVLCRRSRLQQRFFGFTSVTR